MSMMLRSPRVWLYASGLWLISASLAHTGAHVWTLVLENGVVGLQQFAMNAMKQAISSDPLEPSLWRVHRMLSASFALFLLFAGSVNVVLAWIDAPKRVIGALALFGTVFWTLAFVPLAFIDPVIQPILIVMVSVPLHAIAYLTATAGSEGSAGEPG